MGQEPDSTPQAGQEPTPAATPDAGQEPQGKQPKTFDEEYVKGLRAEAARYRTEAQEAKAKAEEYETANASDLEKANKRAEKAEKDAADARSSLLRFEVAAEKQIPADAVELLVGSTREELEAKADKILQFATRKPVDPDFDGGARDPAPEPKTPEQEHNELAAALFGGSSPNQ